MCTRVLHVTHERTASGGRRFRGEPIVLPGIYAGPATASPMGEVDPALVVYAGRHVREKRVRELVRAFLSAPAARAELRLRSTATDRNATASRSSSRNWPRERRASRRAPTRAEVAAALSRAAMLATASEREGYGLVVVEAAARGTPSVVVAGPENGAAELVAEGTTGPSLQAPSPTSSARRSCASWRPGRSSAGRPRAGSRNAHRVSASTRRSS